ncbi:hypothetical protein C8R43DRAFT_996686 [Mycena crocata]|nr:hypothetical protein C8R43DRAFT_996686 [Mycena crocata]
MRLLYIRAVIHPEYHLATKMSQNQNQKNHEALQQAAAMLGLPQTKLPDNTSRPASQVSVPEIKEQGWTLHAAKNFDLNEFWQPDKDKYANKWVQNSTKDRGARVVSDSIKIIGEIYKVREAYMSMGENREPVYISKDYELPNASLSLNSTTTETLEASFLKICLHYVDKAGKKSVAEHPSPPKKESRDLCWVPRRTAPDSVHPAPNLYFEPTTTNLAPGTTNLAPSTTTFTKERAIVSLLRLIAVDKHGTPRVTELTVERLVGSALMGIFDIKACDIISGAKLDFPNYLRPWQKSVAFPDIASLRQSNQNSLLRAVVAIGEGKIRERGMHKHKSSSKSPEESKAPDVRAQIAVAIHPTMILLVIAHCSFSDPKEKNIPLKEIQSPNPLAMAQFGWECLIYGVYYDETEVTILAHFPQILRRDGAAKSFIQFFQIPVATFQFNSESLLERWRLVIALFVVQRHAQRLVEILSPVISCYSLTTLEPAA